MLVAWDIYGGLSSSEWSEEKNAFYGFFYLPQVLGPSWWCGNSLFLLLLRLLARLDFLETDKGDFAWKRNEDIPFSACDYV